MTIIAVAAVPVALTGSSAVAQDTGDRVFVGRLGGLQSAEAFRAGMWSDASIRLETSASVGRSEVCRDASRNSAEVSPRN